MMGFMSTSSLSRLAPPARLQPEQHGADVTGVRGSGKVGFQCHRAAAFGGDGDRALELAAAMRGGHRDSVRGQQRFCLTGGKPAACGLALQQRSDQRARRRPVQVRVVRRLAERP